MRRSLAMIETQSHTAVDRRLATEPVESGDGSALVWLRTTPEKAAEERGLVRGGSLLGAALRRHALDRSAQESR